MAKRKRLKKIYTYECSLTGESFKLTEEAKSPDDLMSVEAWYDIHSDEDDRPEDIKKRLGLLSKRKLEETDAQENKEITTEKK